MLEKENTPRNDGLLQYKHFFLEHSSICIWFMLLLSAIGSHSRFFVDVRLLMRHSKLYAKSLRANVSMAPRMLDHRQIFMRGIQSKA